MDLKESVVQLSSPSPAPRLSVPKSQEQQVNFVEASASVAETPISGPDAIEDGKNQEEEGMQPIVCCCCCFLNVLSLHNSLSIDLFCSLFTPSLFWQLKVTRFT